MWMRWSSTSSTPSIEYLRRSIQVWRPVASSLYFLLEPLSSALSPMM